MDEPTQQPKQEPANPPVVGKAKKKLPMATMIHIVLGALLLAALAFLAWYWMQAEAEKKALNEEKAQLQSQLAELQAQSQKDQTEQATESPAPCDNTPTASRKENIKAALDSKNTEPFKTYTSNPVNYILAASEYGGDVTPDEAAVSLDYTHSATGPWDFNLPAATINTWKAGFYKDHFDDANRYIGMAASGMVVSFDFDCNGKISHIFVAADDGLLE